MAARAKIAGFHVGWRSAALSSCAQSQDPHRLHRPPLLLSVILRMVAGSTPARPAAQLDDECENARMTTLNELSIQTPDDWHLHIRDGAAMAAVVPYTARQFGRAIIMPNLRPPITTTAQAVAYRERILAALPEG